MGTLLPILPPFLGENGRSRLPQLGRVLERLKGVMDRAMQKHPGEVAGKVAEGVLFGLPKAVWELGKGMAHMAQSAGEVMSPVTNPVEKAAGLWQLADDLTNGFFSAAPKVFQSYLESHGDVRTPSQKALALGTWVMFHAPAEFVAHTFGALGEATVDSMERGDASGAVANLLLGGAFAASLVSPISGARPVRRIIERKAISHEWVSLPEVQKVLQGRKPSAEIGVDADGVPSSVKKPYARPKPAADAASAVKEAAGNVAEGGEGVADWYQAQAAMGDSPLRIKALIQQYRKETGMVDPPFDALKQWAQEKKGITPEDFDAAFELARKEGSVGLADAMLQEQDVKVVVELTKHPSEPLPVDEALKRALPMTEVLEAEAHRNVVRRLLETEGQGLVNLLNLAAGEKGAPGRITPLLATVMEKNPKLFEDVIVSALQLDPVNAADYVRAYADVMNRSASVAGGLLEVSSEVANYVRGLSVAEKALLDALQDLQPEPPGTSKLAWRWLTQRYRELTKDVVNRVAEQKAQMRRHASKTREARKSLIAQQLEGQLPEEMVTLISEDPSLHLFMRKRGGALKVLSADEARALAEKVKAGELPDIEMPQIVLGEDPFPGVPLTDLPHVLRPAVGRIRKVNNVLGGGSGERFIASVSNDLGLFEKYSAIAEMLTDDEILAKAGLQASPHIDLTIRGLVNRWWGMVETARGGFGLAMPRSAIRDVTNTFLMSGVALGDALMTAVVDAITPGPAPTLHALLEAGSALFATPRVWETWVKAQKLLDQIPPAAETFRSAAVPIELLDTLANQHVVYNRIEAVAAESVAKAVTATNLLRTTTDRMVRSVLFSEFLVYELAKRGLERRPGRHLIDEALELLQDVDPEWTPKVKEAVYEATRKAAELSMADRPVPGEILERALDVGEIRKGMVDILGENVKVRWADTTSIAAAALEVFQRAPFLRTIFTMYPRFWVNVWQTILAHHPGNILSVFNPQFRKLMMSEDPAIRAQAVEHVGKGLTGAFLLASSFYVYRNHSMGKPYLLEIQKEDGSYEKVDTRAYKPFDVYLGLAAVFDMMLTGRKPNMNANEYFDLITGLRRMTDQPFSAMYPLLEQLATGNDEAIETIAHRLATQVYSPLLTPLAALTETGELLVSLFDPETRAKMYRQGDVSTSPLMSPVSRISRSAANWLSQQIGGDPHFAVPEKVDPYTAKPAQSTTRPYLFYLTGLAAEQVPALERAFLKAGVDPIQALDPQERSTPYANLYRKLVGMLVASPLSDATMPSDMERAMVSGMADRVRIDEAVRQLVKEGGVGREEMASDGVADVRLSQALEGKYLDHEMFMEVLQSTFLDPVYSRDEQEAMIRKYRTVGDFAAAIIMDDKVAEHFRLKVPGTEQRMSVDDARTYVARGVSQILRARIKPSEDVFRKMIQTYAPWLMVDQLYQSLPAEMRRHAPRGNIRGLARMDPADLYGLLGIASKAGQPAAGAALLGGGR